MALLDVAPSRGVIHELMTMRDPRTTNWKTLDDPIYLVVLLAGYVYMATVWGPRFMKDRRPYKIDTLIQGYNLFQITANTYFSVRIFDIAYRKLNMSLICQGIDYKVSENTMELLNLLYSYLIIRISDFADTLFFVLRKKFSHVTQLHLIHHVAVVFSGWQWLRVGSDGQTLLIVCLNSAIHVVMYSYYFLAKLGPNVRKHLWWKKYLTVVQIAQFVVMIVHSLIPAVVMECGFPRALVFLAVAKILLILVLFINFYIKSYGRTGAPTPESRTSQAARSLTGKAD